MANANERIFKVGEIVHVIDWTESAKELIAIKTEGKIIYVNNESNWFTILLYDELHERYRFEDYGILVFDTEKEVAEALSKLPTPTTTVYHVIGRRIYKKKVKRIGERFSSTFKELIIKFERGKPISIKEMGNTLFFTRAEAKEWLKKKKT